MCARDVKWANRLMEQSHCYISPFTVKKVKVYFNLKRGVGMVMV